MKHVVCIPMLVAAIGGLSLSDILPLSAMTAAVVSPVGYCLLVCINAETCRVPHPGAPGLRREIFRALVSVGVLILVVFGVGWAAETFDPTTAQSAIVAGTVPLLIAIVAFGSKREGK